MPARGVGGEEGDFSGGVAYHSGVEADFTLVGQVVRDHCCKKKGATHVFGDIVSYILKRFYHDPGLEFNPDGRLLATEAPQELSRTATLTCGQQELSPKLLAQVVGVSQDE